MIAKLVKDKEMEDVAFIKNLLANRSSASEFLPTDFDLYVPTTDPSDVLDIHPGVTLSKFGVRDKKIGLDYKETQKSRMTI
jgi:hypothetical protein